MAFVLNCCMCHVALWRPPHAAYFMCNAAIVHADSKGELLPPTFLPPTFLTMFAHRLQCLKTCRKS